MNHLLEFLILCDTFRKALTFVPSIYISGNNPMFVLFVNANWGIINSSHFACTFPVCIRMHVVSKLLRSAFENTADVSLQKLGTKHSVR
jgi:hypothetical protein